MPARVRIPALSLAVALTIVGLSSSALTQDDTEDSPYRPGLIATFTSSDRTATRTDEIVAFDWQNAAADPRLPATEFTATWRGRLWARGAGTYRLACYVQGEVELKLAGKTVISGRAEQPQWLHSQPLELEFDYHPLEITFRRTQPNAQLSLFWSGPDFQLEPIPARALVHDRAQSPSTSFERGRQLATALRCAACHQDTTASVTPAPALDRLTGNIDEKWLVGWLRAPGDVAQEIQIAPELIVVSRPTRRMPHVPMNQEEATAIAAWLLREPAAPTEPKKAESKEPKSSKNSEKSKKADDKGSKKAREEKPQPSAAEGERILLTRGCLACHQLGSLGESGLFGGGDLTLHQSKRPAGFLTRWLRDPAAINRSHRMPVFTFTADELESLDLWELGQWNRISPRSVLEEKALDRRPLIPQGERLVTTFQCGNCHVLSRTAADLVAAKQSSLTAASNWSRTCSGQPNRERNQPGYQLQPVDQDALKTYYSAPRSGESQLSTQSRGRDLLAKLNCLACHQREGATLPLPLGEGWGQSIPGLPAPLPLPDKLAAVGEQHPSLAPLIPAMTPPALNSVGDKLHDTALSDSISRQGPPHRPYLLVQMPKFNLTKDQLAALTAYFTSTDRIPVGNALRGVPDQPKDSANLAALLSAGPRLVTTDGLACTSCHQVGSVLPSKAPLNARGPDMSMLGNRIRREWFDRWCENPARIVPRMEMPAVKIPVRGVLNEKIDDQLAAVWHILNTPGFEPPEPNPVRVLRLSGVPEKNERPIVIHDVFKDGDKTWLYPLVIGLPNRHNILFDLETNRLAAWWLGDTARQRTKGKSWFWEMGGKPIPLDRSTAVGPTLILNGKELVPRITGQFVEPEIRNNVNGEAFGFDFRLRYMAEKEIVVRASELYVAKSDANGSGFARLISFWSIPVGAEPRLQLVDSTLAEHCRWDGDSQTLHLPGNDAPTIQVKDHAVWEDKGTIRVPPRPQSPSRDDAFNWVMLEYRWKLPVDQFIVETPPLLPVATATIDIAPGFSARRLPLPDDIMPSGFTWDEQGKTLFCTLKGQVISTFDSDGDGIEDRSETIVDGLPTPYGISAHSAPHENANFKYKQLIDVITKTSLIQLNFHELLGESQPVVDRLASGWGSTDDYHDWAVGLIQGDQGEYYIALPCQQDQRTPEAARLRGQFLKLTPRKPTPDDRSKFKVEVISAGHRFPMGIARNRDGELFVTDNQGNYNPFNELNHVRKGAHFGFINALEKEKGFTPPPLTEPAINIPHPWTRSVNGICFLDSPAQIARTKPSLYGPFEGHLVGCEYDTRRLIRMSLQKIGDTYQGCAYPLSIPPDDVEKGLLGPIVCAIKPTTGELYVGEIRDSGWGASNNIGQIVKIKIEPEELPCGIAEVRATSTGFTIDFIQPVDRAKAADVASYSIQSYRRESTPAYGGPDLDRRDENISAVTLSEGAKRATLTLPTLRPGHVYELQLKNLTPAGGIFHPDQAHYTLRQIPN